MTPKPWSHSALSDFENCPRSFYEKRIAKSVVETKGVATIWGEQVHEHFENRLRDGAALPDNLAVHEGFMEHLSGLPGKRLVEAKIALDNKLRPCGFFDDNVWYRGVIDYGLVDGARAYLVDHKTGKHHSKFGQLKLFALHTLAAYPEVEEVRAEYYWTQTLTANGETYHRSQYAALWSEFLPALRQYAQAFHEDIWQPRQSGLCNGWCPVESCEFWKPKRRK